MMELNGREADPAASSARRLQGTRREKEQQQLENMFDELLDDIQSCKARLSLCDDGSASWELSSEAVHIKKELARHVDDLKRIDDLLSLN